MDTGPLPCQPTLVARSLAIHCHGFTTAVKKLLLAQSMFYWHLTHIGLGCKTPRSFSYILLPSQVTLSLCL